MQLSIYTGTLAILSSGLSATPTLYTYVIDTFLFRMLSKSKGQVLRIAAVMHVLFHVDTTK